ncbi:CocE/NonD family hydrolase [Amycolatopsis sp. NPDC001319]|uniref:CocE/NonD family hydrolase n=1 Tax=unclassified Amycolatopsis TaxID=2618356 RepID=UPI0036B42A21
MTATAPPTPLVITEHDIRIPMRDGVLLRADLWRPAEPDRHPVLISRTPYSPSMVTAALNPHRLAAAGFAVLVQHCRGRFGSGGTWSYVHSDVEDGYDTVEWAAGRPWSDGRVGMFGQSYGGSTQWLAAQTRPPHLEVIAPEACAADYWEGTFDAGGTFRLALRVGWTAHVISEMAEEWGIDDARPAHLRSVTLGLHSAVATGDPEQRRQARAAAATALDEIFRTRPFRDNPLWHGRAGWLEEAFDHESRDDSTWLRHNPTTHYSGIDLPALHIGSWYDIHLGATLRHYTGMRRQAPTAAARAAQRLIIGPWDHWHPTVHLVGEVDFGPEAAIDITAVRARWFRRHFDGAPDDTAPVRLFVMGRNEWRDEAEWPLARTEFTPFYLHDGAVLDPRRPTADTGADAFTYDPRDPVPTIGGRLLGSGGEVAGPADQRPNLARGDVLTYLSAELTEELELTGPVTMDLWASTDAPDTDFTAVLLDVHPDGRALNLCEGAVRARHQLPATPLEPGAVYHFTLDLAATSIVLAPGHRVGVYVSSSSYPEWEPNPNTGNPLGTDTNEDLRTARQTVHRTAACPSRVVLPIIPR